MEVIPKMANKLKILEPIKFPTDISSFFSEGGYTRSN